MPSDLNLDLGEELLRFQRRHERDITVGVGLSRTAYYMGVFYAMLLSYFLSIPLIFLATQVYGVDGSPLADPFWGPLIGVWFFFCTAVMCWFMYFAPRRCYLAIHEKGFVCRQLLRRYVVRYSDIAGCDCPTDSFAVHFLLKDGARVSFSGLKVQFPIEAVVQLVEHVERNSGEGTVRLAPGDEPAKARLRIAGTVAGLLFFAILMVIPFADAEGRARLVRAFGDAVVGIPYYLFLPPLMALFFWPVILAGRHAVIISGAQMPGLARLYSPRELRRSKIIAIGCGVYAISAFAAFVVLVENLMK